MRPVPDASRSTVRKSCDIAEFVIARGVAASRPPRRGVFERYRSRAQRLRQDTPRGPDMEETASGSAGPQRSAEALADGSGDVGASGRGVERVDRLARGHEQPVAVLADKAQIGGPLGHHDLTDPG